MLKASRDGFSIQYGPWYSLSENAMARNAVWNNGWYRRLDQCPVARTSPQEPSHMVDTIKFYREHRQVYLISMP